MVKIDIITIFPDIFDSYFNKSIVARALKQKAIDIEIHDLRQYAETNYKSVDDKPFSGGPGMILKIEPIYKALENIKIEKGEKVRKILFSANGKKYTQDKAKKFTKYDRIILICGRYEGVDARVKKFVDEEISIGEYVLTGGEIPAMIVVDSISRLMPGVITQESLEDESFNEKGFLEYPQYTRPEVFETKDGKKLRVPKVLLSGNHKLIQEWKSKHAK